ncbi:hypothetical protein BDQ12DRAFT_721124 [Crucibulum laeve]|uniref:Uncharacterized protein n=1 Tax=Crucibulum laeve TaxID=68775 RepID=A0A5C3M4Y6_9AGAR|nr:hypothetical protein BDQ12DRAFT_721124 [Crucibulum laeve]
MPILFPRRRRKLPPRYVDSQSSPQPAAPPPQNAMPPPRLVPFVERKIHPDLNALAAQVDPSPHREQSLKKETCRRTRPSSHSSYYERKSSSVEFLPLSPSVRRKKPREKRRIESPIDAYTSTPRSVSPLPPFNVGSSHDWPTFGRKQARNSLTPSDPRGRNISSSDILQEEYDTSIRSRHRASWRHSASTDTQPHTPTSVNFTPHSRSGSSRDLVHRDLAPSRNTFGFPTPPSSGFTFRSTRRSSSFNFEETPPPLPPLDHPAFHISSDTFGREARSILPQLLENESIPETITRSRSLPSLPKTQIKYHRSGTERSRNGRHPLRRSTIGPSTRKSNRIHAKQVFDHRPSQTSLKVPRRDSKNNMTSIGSSRRSSADYSAKRASSIGQSSEHEETWEVLVAKEMVRLSSRSSNLEPLGSHLGTAPNQDTPFSTFGSSSQARGDNVGVISLSSLVTIVLCCLLTLSTGGKQPLGLPFLLQDTPTDYLADTRLDEIYTNSSGSKYSPTRQKKKTRKRTIFDIMSQSDTNPPPEQNKGKGRESDTLGSISTPRKATKTSSNTRSRRGPSSPAPKLRPIPDFGPVTASSSLLAPPALQVTSPTPEVSPISPTSPTRRTHHKSSPAEPSSSVLRHASPPPVQKSYSSGSTGKRKADDVEGGGTPPKEQQREQRATFAIGPRRMSSYRVATLIFLSDNSAPAHRISGTSNSSSYAPSSYNRQKRTKLTSTPESTPNSRSGSRDGQGTSGDSPNAKSIGSWASRGSNHGSHNASRAASISSHAHRAPSRRSLSQASIPISALVSPHAPSVARSSKFHMRDPRRPAPIQSTPWSLSFPERVERGGQRWALRGWVERGGSPLHAWLFFIGFIIFPIWWAAALFIGIPRTRRLGGDDSEKGVVLDDPQVEHDAKSWRLRCRIMAVVSLFTYIPFIVLVAIFAR